MELRDRLARLGYTRAATPVQVQSAMPRPDIHELLPGAQRACFVAESRYPLDHVHGGAALSDLLGQPGEAFALLTGDERLRDLSPERAVMVDCETTGLAGGTGTYAFLIGLGYFAEGQFRVDQIFLREPGAERETLRELGETLRRFDAVISFNGKCFDWPLMQTRHVYNRVALPSSLRLHLDLLFPARRLYRRRLASCALDELEYGVLGMPRRAGDVPGWLIPQIYFDYLRKRDGRPLIGVFEHNRQDILTMVALAVRMARHAADPIGFAPEHPMDVASLGRLLALAGRHELAEALFERAIADDVPWSYPYVEVAKRLEHRDRSFARAREMTREAMRRHTFGAAPTRVARERAELEHRMSRLQRKLALFA